MTTPTSSPEDSLEQLEALPFDLILDSSNDVDFVPEKSGVVDEDVDVEPLNVSDDFSTPEPPSSSGSSSSIAKSPANGVATTPKPRRIRVPQTQRIKAEMAFLHEQIASLEKKLREIMARHAAANCNAPPTAWRAVARRQHARRSAAEKENERLRQKLLRQLQLAKSLEVVMRHRSTEFFEQLEPRPCPQHWPCHTAAQGDVEQVLKRFAVDIQHAYAGVDLVIPGVEADSHIPLFERLPGQSAIKSHPTNGGEQIYVELRHAIAVPFALDRVKDVLWRVVTTEFERQDRLIDRYILTDNTQGFKFKVRLEDALTEPGNEETVTTLSRMYVEEDRVVVISRGFLASRNSQFTEALCVQTTWSVYRSMKHLDNHVAIHSCSRGVPLRADIIPSTSENLARMPTNAPEVGSFTTQMLCTTADVLPSVVESMENLILDEGVDADGEESEIVL